jgi:hypothetical protein
MNMLLTLTLYVFTALTAHEFHVSKTLIEFNEQDQALQISMHIFLDDLEDALRLRGADQLYLCTEKETPEAEGYLETYLRKNFEIQLNDQDVDYTFLGKEISEDLAAAWCYIEIPNVTLVESLAVRNELLLDLYDDQKNIIHIIGPAGKQGYFMFQKGDTQDRVRF